MNAHGGVVYDEEALTLARATTWLMTGYLWGISVTDLTTFVLSAGAIVGLVLFASRVEPLLVFNQPRARKSAF